jgi:hypothetical protein
VTQNSLGGLSALRHCVFSIPPMRLRPMAHILISVHSSNYNAVNMHT